MPRGCLGGEPAPGETIFLSWCFLPWWLARGRKRRKQGKEPGDGGREPFHFVPIFPPASPVGGGPGRGSRGLPGSHGPGMCSLLHFYHNNSLINSPAAAAVAAQTCASEGVGHVALPEPREGARSARPLPSPRWRCLATGNS